MLTFALVCLYHQGQPVLGSHRISIPTLQIVSTKRAHSHKTREHRHTTRTHTHTTLATFSWIREACGMLDDTLELASHFACCRQPAAQRFVPHRCDISQATKSFIVQFVRKISDLKWRRSCTCSRFTMATVQSSWAPGQGSSLFPPRP